jgi:hypothetical protein
MDPDCKYWNGDCTATGEIWRSGFVALGGRNNYVSSKAKFFQLAVTNGITSEQLKICKTAWCDYVFDDTFYLKPLPDVASFIEAKKHLPGCTPGSIIEEQDGFDLHEQTIQQQAKIEEAFLHLIQLDERVDKLNKKLHANKTNESTAPKIFTPAPIIDKPIREKLENAVVIECFEITPATSNVALDGLAGIIITGATGPFKITWGLGGVLENIICDGMIRIPYIKAGSYTFRVFDSNGIYLGACSTTINIDPLSSSFCSSILSRGACNSAIMNLVEGEFNTEKRLCKQWLGDQCSNIKPIYRLGSVCIGTSVGKSGFNLAVAGGIVTDKFRVELCEGMWCDYVFDPKYNLIPLQEVKKYVLKNKSLPNMINQDKITADGGYELKSAKMEQQVKIEEAYLHIIELNKNINELNNKLQKFQ